jgi:hypothetical protein
LGTNPSLKRKRKRKRRKRRKRRKMTKRMMMRKKTKNPTIRRYSPHCSHLRRTRQ